MEYYEQLIKDGITTAMHAFNGNVRSIVMQTILRPVTISFDVTRALVIGATDHHNASS